MPRMRQFRIRELLNSVSSLMAEQARAHKVSLETRCQPETLELQADPDLLEQALINLLRNAIEASAELDRPRVAITAELKERGRVELSVTDNGSGIEPENLENIFIPFFTTKRGGSGIGMSIVKQIVKLNGGKVKVLSTPGVRTSVVISF
ncbi:MAG: ATP-binding protein [Pseudomonadales bacterium]|nr:ATP-binding protein [Pseudomonadales bacterium]